MAICGMAAGANYGWAKVYCCSVVCEIGMPPADPATLGVAWGNSTISTSEVSVVSIVPGVRGIAAITGRMAALGESSILVFDHNRLMHLKAP